MKWSVVCAYCCIAAIMTLAILFNTGCTARPDAFFHSSVNWLQEERPVVWVKKYTQDQFRLDCYERNGWFTSGKEACFVATKGGCTYLYR